MDITSKPTRIDRQTVTTLENSLAMQVLNLFAIIAMADGVLTDEEKDFVQEYCGQLYPPEIADFLFTRFNEYTGGYAADRSRLEFDIETISRAINQKLSYQEKIFSLLKLYELLEADEAEEHEIQFVHLVAGKFGVAQADLAFIDSIFGLPVKGDISHSAIIKVVAADTPGQGDVCIPCPGLFLEIYKIYNLYCLRLVQKHDSTRPRESPLTILVDNHPLLGNHFTRIPHNAVVKVEDYPIKYQDLKTYFENRTHPLETDLYLEVKGEVVFWDKTPQESSYLHLKLNSSRMILTPLREDVCCLVNGVPITGWNQVYVNLNDQVVLDGRRLSLREVFFHLNRERLIPLDPDKKTYEITNDARGDIFIADDLTDKWTARITKENGSFVLDRGDYPYQIRVNGQPLEGQKAIGPEDSIFINNRYLFLNTH
ncbi:MAG: TerB family tellurite resistance protein, partial [Thermodesulfobacteriota bacterium]